MLPRQYVTTFGPYANDRPRGMGTHPWKTMLQKSNDSKVIVLGCPRLPHRLASSLRPTYAIRTNPTGRTFGTVRSLSHRNHFPCSRA